MAVNNWTEVEQALWYLQRADDVPHRTEGEQCLLEALSFTEGPIGRVLDIGTGDGRLLDLVRTAYPGITGVGLDFSPPMLERFSERFNGVAEVSLVEHNLDGPIPDLGTFDAVVSSFAIHHTSDERKRQIDREVLSMLRPGGVFANLEHVASATRELQVQFYEALDLTEQEGDDPANQLSPVEDQLTWMREAGFVNVDNLWRWRELALLVGWRPQD